MPKRPVKKSSVAVKEKPKKKPWPTCSRKDCDKQSIMFRRLFDGTEIHTCTHPEHQKEWYAAAKKSKPKSKGSLIESARRLRTVEWCVECGAYHPAGEHIPPGGQSSESASKKPAKKVVRKVKK